MIFHFCFNLFRFFYYCSWISASTSKCQGSFILIPCQCAWQAAMKQHFSDLRLARQHCCVPACLSCLPALLSAAAMPGSQTVSLQSLQWTARFWQQVEWIRGLQLLTSMCTGAIQLPGCSMSIQTFLRSRLLALPVAAWFLCMPAIAFLLWHSPLIYISESTSHIFSCGAPVRGGLEGPSSCLKVSFPKVSSAMFWGASFRTDISSPRAPSFAREEAGRHLCFDPEAQKHWDLLPFFI